MQKIFLVLLAFVIISCGDEVLPKPKGQLRLEYPEGVYSTFKKECPFFFEINDNVILKEKADCAYELHYPKMKAIKNTFNRPFNDVCTLSCLMLEGLMKMILWNTWIF